MAENQTQMGKYELPQDTNVFNGNVGQAINESIHPENPMSSGSRKPGTYL